MTKPKIALITGGSRGIGRSTAEALARRGIASIITYQAQANAAEEVVAEIASLGQTAIALPLDVAQPATFADFAARVRGVLQTTWGVERIDYLVNNAGSGIYSSVADTTEADLDRMFAEHVKGVVLLTQALLPVLSDGGRIINLSSGLARFAMAGTAPYAIMKGAIEVFTRVLAKEVGARGITVNTVAPGAVATDFGGGRLRDSAEMQQIVAGNTALGRTATAEDIGPMIAALLAEENGWVNAQRIEVSGGMLI